MRDISELIYETCKTYLVTQGKFILLLELFIGVIMSRGSTLLSIGIIVCLLGLGFGWSSSGS